MTVNQSAPSRNRHLTLRFENLESRNLFAIAVSYDGVTVTHSEMFMSLTLSQVVSEKTAL